MKIFGYGWLALVCFALTAVILSTDSDINGLQHLLPEHFASVLLLSIPFLAASLLCLELSRQRGLRGFLLIALPLSFLLSTGLFGMMTPKLSGLELLRSVVYTAGVLTVALSLAALPAKLTRSLTHQAA